MDINKKINTKAIIEKTNNVNGMRSNLFYELFTTKVKKVYDAGTGKEINCKPSEIRKYNEMLQKIAKLYTDANIEILLKKEQFEELLDEIQYAKIDTEQFFEVRYGYNLFIFDSIHLQIIKRR